ncbi:membrane dipeptidase [Alisedimentitalea sp. MJ-SS2]|nr:membrane dipeptidase [Alisedimentitalea sp. MJ-SS2]
MRWIKRLLAGVLVLAVLGLIGFWTFAPAIVEKGRNAVARHAPYPVSETARALHDRLVVGDWHADSLLWKRDLLTRGERGQVDVHRLLEGGVAVQVFTAVTKSPTGQNYDSNSSSARDNITLLAFGQLWPVRTWTSIYERAVYQAEKLRGFEAASEGRLKIIRSKTDLESVLQARADGQQVVGGILGVEGLHPLEGEFDNLEGLIKAGHRVFGLQHFFDNALGGSLHGEGNHGLTEFGRKVVAELAVRPVIIDVAHSSPQVARDVLEMVDVPIVLSHTGIHSHCPVKRNFPNELMQAIAKGGGVIGIGYWAEVACDQINPDGIAAMIKAGIAAVGEDHISLGSDFDGSIATAFDTSELPALTDALIRAGVSETQIAKVMGENMMRVLRDRLE